MNLKATTAVLASLFAAHNEVWAAPMATCEQQAPCIKFDTTENPGGSNCGCQCDFTVCLTIDQSSSSCKKSGSISHVCDKDTGNGLCMDDTFSGFGYAAELANIANGYTMCETGAPGTTLEFLLKDGAGCGGSATVAVMDMTQGPIPVSVGDASCLPRPAATQSCTGNGVGQECIWTVTTPSECQASVAGTYSGSSPLLQLPVRRRLQTGSGSITQNPANGALQFDTTPAVSGSITGADPNDSDYILGQATLPVNGLTDFFFNKLDTTFYWGDKSGTLDAWPLDQCTPSISPIPLPPTAPPSGVNGDPHFRTWAGQRYDFHGICDLALLKNPDFANRRGMEIHVRTKQTKQWSYVSTAVLRVGEDTLEVMGGKDENRYWVNKVAGKPLEDKATLSAFAGYPVEFTQISDRSRQFVVHLGDGERVVIKTWNAMVSVNFEGATSANFGTSLGLMGSFQEGLRMNRNRSAVIEDVDAFGQHWQVLASEPMLFHNIGDGPQAPEVCVMPSKSEMRRRLALAVISTEEAELACSRVDPAYFDMCVFDVMATNDKGTAGAY